MWKLVITFLALIALPSQAHAVTALVTVIAAAFGGGLIATAIAYAVVSFAVSYIVNKVFAPEKEERDAPADQGVKQRIATDPRNKLPVVYGKKSVAGQITYASISSDNQKMAFIISLAEGPVSSINSVKWEDKTLSFSGDISTGLRSCSNATPDAGGSDDFLNSGRFKVQVFLGGDNNNCPPMESFDSTWNTDSSARNMPNTAYAYCELTYDQEKRVTSLTNRLQFNITGRKVRPITSSTDETNYLSNSEVESFNPAEILADYLTNTRYGAGVPLSAIDFATFNSHKIFCDDTTQTYTPADGGTPLSGKKRYTINGVINTNQDVDQNVTDLTVGNSAMLTWNYGQFGLVSDKEKDSVFSFSENNIYGKIQISKLGFDNKLNEITAKFDSFKSKEQEEQIIIPFTDINDNEPVLERTVTLPMTDNAIEARRVAAIYINKSRQDLTVNFSTSLEASGIEAGDVIEVAHATPGWPTAADITAGRSGKEFLVHSVEEKVANGIVGLEITAQEYADGVYTDVPNDEDPAPNTSLPNPFKAPDIRDLVVAEDTTVDEPNLSITWVETTDSVLVSSTELGYRDSNIETTVVTGITFERDPEDSTPQRATLTVSTGGTSGFPASGVVLVGVTTKTSTVSGQPVIDSTGVLLPYISASSDSFEIDLDDAPVTGSGPTVSTGDTVTLPLTFKSTAGGTKYELSPLIASAEKVTTLTFTGTPTTGTYTIDVNGTDVDTTIDATPQSLLQFAADVASQITLVSGYEATSDSAVVTINGTLNEGNYSITPPSNPTLGLTVAKDVPTSLDINNYHVQVTSTSTLGNRSESLFKVSQIGLARVIGIPGADGDDGASITVTQTSGANPGDTSTITFDSSDPAVPDVVTTIQPGEDGVDGTSELSIYINQGATDSNPPTPDTTTFTGRSITGGIGDNGNDVWFSTPTASITQQRWVSRASVGDSNLLQETGNICFDENAVSGILTRTVGHREAGYFDFSGIPGTNVNSIFEKIDVDTKGTTGERTIVMEQAEIHTIRMQGANGTGLDNAYATGRGDRTTVTLAGTSNNSMLVDNGSGPSGLGATNGQGILFNPDLNGQGTKGVSTVRGQAYGDRVLVYVGEGGSGSNGGVSRSLDGGLTWTGELTGGSDRINDVAFGGGIFVGACDNGKVIVSTNSGDSWSYVTIAGSNDLNSIAYSNGVFITCGEGNSLYGAADNVDLTSSANWGSNLTTGSGISYSRVKAGKSASGTGNDVFVAVGSSGYITSTGTIANQVVPSFTQRQSSGNTINGIDFNEEDQQWGACANGGLVYTSENSTSWDSRSTSYGDDLLSIACGLGHIVASRQVFFFFGNTHLTVAANGSLATWTSTAFFSFSVARISVIRFIPEMRAFFAIGRQGGTVIAQSNNATDWEDINFGDSSFQVQDTGSDFNLITYVPDFAHVGKDNTATTTFSAGTAAESGSGGGSTDLVQITASDTSSFPDTGSLILNNQNDQIFNYYRKDATTFFGVNAFRDISLPSYSSGNSIAYSNVVSVQVSSSGGLGGASFRSRVEADARDDSRSNSEAALCDRLVIMANIAPVRSTQFEVEVIDAVNTQSVFGSFSNEADSDTMASELADRVNSAIADSTTTNLRTVTSTGSALTIEQSADGAQGTSLDKPNLVVTTDTFNGISTKTQPSPLASASQVKSDGAAGASNTPTQWVVNGIPANHTVSSIALTNFSTGVDMLVALGGFKTAFDSATSNYDTVLTGTTTDATLTITSNATPLINEDDATFNIDVTNGTFGTGQDVSITDTFSKTQDGIVALDVGLRTTFTLTVEGTALATTEFTDNSNAASQVTQIETVFDNAGITDYSFTIDGSDDSKFTVLAITNDGDRADSELVYTEIGASNRALDSDVSAGSVSTLTIDDGTDLNVTGGTIIFTEETNSETFTYSSISGNVITFSPAITLVNSYTSASAILTITLDIAPTVARTTGVDGRDTKDNIIIDFGGTGNDPVVYTTNFPEALDLDGTLSSIISQANNTTGFGIDGITFYDGNSTATTSLAEDIQGGDDHTFVAVDSTLGFTDSGTVTITDGTNTSTFVYTSILTSEDSFGTCSDGSTANQSSACGATFTPVYRLLGTAQTLLTISATGGTVTSGIRYPGVSLSTDRRVAWEYDAVGTQVNTTVTDLSITTGGDTNGNLAIVSFNTEDQGVAETITGSLTTADIVIDDSDGANTYTVTYVGRDIDNGLYNSYITADAAEQARQLAIFLDNQT